MLESAVSEVNKVGCEIEKRFFPTSKTGHHSEMRTNTEETSVNAPSDALAG